MKRYSIETVISDFEKSGEVIFRLANTDDYVISNREGKKLVKYFKIFEKNLEFGYQCIDRLIESSNVVVKTKAAAYSLALSYNTSRAISVLEEIASNSDNGIFRFNAEMTLKVWREQGYLMIYQ